jgi:hypothetical protein
MSRRWVLLPALVLALAGAAIFLRFLTRDRDVIASTPSPRPVFTVTYVPLDPGRRLCIGDVTIPHDARRLRFAVRTYGRPGPALHVALAGRTVAVSAGYPDGAQIDVPMTPPERTQLGSVCLRSEGRVALVGSTEERTQSRPQSRLDGRPVAADSYLAFGQGRSASALRETPQIIGRMSAFKPGIAGPWLLWPLLVLVVAGMPAGIVWALLRAAGA